MSTEAFDEFAFSEEELAVRRLTGPFREPDEWPAELAAAGTDMFVDIRPLPGDAHARMLVMVRPGLDADRRRSLCRHVLGRLQDFVSIGPVSSGGWFAGPDGDWQLLLAAGDLLPD